ncbi:MAG TPA: cation-transporting P-type ATPase, partial [Verrucomicrobiae bacterium]
MSSSHEKHSGRGGEAGQCLARSVVDTLAEEPALEAVTIDRAHQKISVATLGRIPQGGIGRLTERITREFEAAQSVSTGRNCNLLTGQDDCRSCDRPLSETERKKITIQNDGPTTTIARVTCPTAPKFWRWRDIPFPKVVQRDVEFLEHAQEIDEWKPQLAAAILCGVLGLTAHFLLTGHGSVAAYVFAYLAGGFYPAEEVWERLQKRTIDVHFLMIFVAAGAAGIGAWAEGATLLFLFSFSGALEHYALGRTQKEIRSLFRDAPKVATVLDAQGHEREVKVEQLTRGMRLLIKPGAQFPVDAEIAKGSTAADESNLTGEATPVEKNVGDATLAGTINLWGAVEAIVTRPAAESSLQKIVTL